MVAKFDQYIRWDFLGLSTDTKPTPTTSEDVTDGSTYYEVDTSKLYVWCQDNWYEKEDTGGGGGTSQPPVKVLTEADKNYPENNPTSIVLSKLPDGIYVKGDSTNVYVGTTSQSGKNVLQYGEYATVAKNVNNNNVIVYIARFGGDYFAVVDADGNPSSNNTRPSSIMDRLNSTSTSAALSANQGKILNEKINVVAMPLTLNEATGVLTTQQTCAQIKSLINEGKIFIPYVTLSDQSIVEGGIVIISRENTGGNIVIYIFDGDSAQFILISLTAATDNDHFTGNLPS